ncbi:MAG: glucokinase [Deltaproteobacteria bacterium]|nr:glucokinase [Deltaproteobacteria bacterium]
MKTATVLAGDIGGTKTNLAVFTAESGLNAPITEATFPSGDYPSLEVIVQEFLSGTQTKIDIASFGVAGPVVNGKSKITNLPWMMDEARLANALGIASVHLLNDLLALASAVPLLTGKDLHVLNTGRAVSGGPMAVVAPGTGLGEAYLTWDGTTYRAHASEGGHADFAPSNALEIGLLQYLLKRFDHVSYERVCSGSGLVNIYTYLKDSGYAEEPAWLADQMASVHDPTPAIVQAALDEERPCRLCQATLNMFISILGAEAGNVALKVMASGGVYLGGGILPRIVSAIEKGPFMEAFGRKGRMSHLLEDIPVYVILNPKAALMGAACHGMALNHSAENGKWAMKRN